MQLDPQVRALLERAVHWPSYPALGVEGARRMYREARRKLAPAPPEVARIENLHAPGPAGEVPVRSYRPLGALEADRPPVLVYFHGGGWTLGDLDTHDAVCRELANLARCGVVAVDYRLAPEHKFPAAVEDAIVATRWVVREADALGFDARRVAVGGDSSGGNLAAVTAIALRDAGDPPLALQLLIYPATDLANNTESHALFGDGYLAPRETTLWFTANYLRDPSDAADWRASPLKARDLSRLAPAYVMTAGFDPLRDEGRAYADRLHAAGVKVTYECFEGMIHGFVTMGGLLAAAHHALYRASQGLRTAFEA
jgi:acetyl esterase